jgi:hypothetical protein
MALKEDPNKDFIEMVEEVEGEEVRLFVVDCAWL